MGLAELLLSMLIASGSSFKRKDRAGGSQNVEGAVRHKQTSFGRARWAGLLDLSLKLLLRDRTVKIASKSIGN